MYVLHLDLLAEHILEREHDLVGLRAQLVHEQAALRGHAQPLALTDRVAVDALVLPEHIALLVDKIARRAGRAVALEPAVHIAVRDKADVHAVRLVRDRKAYLARVFAHLVLARAPAEREHAPRDRFARQAVHHIGLVLGRAGAEQ